MSSKRFFNAVLNIMPNDIDCYIQAPSLEESEVLDLMTDTEYSYYQKVALNDKTKPLFIRLIKQTHAIDYFQSIELRKGETLLFEGYDGVLYGQISKSIDLPDWFKKKYVEDGTCIISTEW